MAIGDVPARNGDEVLQLDGEIITAGLVNAHHHVYQWMTRGRATGCDLSGWLAELYPIWGRLTIEDVAAAARVGLSELLLSGSTTTADHHFIVPYGDDTVFDALAETALDVGIRLHLVRGSIDLGRSDGRLAPDHLVQDLDAILASTERVADRWHDANRIHVAVGPSNPFNVTPELLRESAALARARGLRLHTHLAETDEEVAMCLERFGKRPLELLEDLGWIADDAWYAHGVHINDAEMRRLAAAAVGIAHCPSSNARLASGVCRLRDLMAVGVPVGLGVDGVASNDQGRLMPELRHALLTARQRMGRADALTAEQALDLGTRGGSACLGVNDIGRLEVGARADLVTWPADDLTDFPDPIVGLVFGPDRDARHVHVDGVQVVGDGTVLGLDLPSARADLGVRSRRLWT